MKKIDILCVGKVKESFIREGIAEYIKRLSRYADVTITELPDRPDTAAARSLESADILEKIGGFTILADIKGKEISSEQFAVMIERAYLTNPKVQLIIGGSRGVTDEVRRVSSEVISFGRMTYPHMLMRLIAAEQIYRAFTIAEGTGYHK